MVHYVGRCAYRFVCHRIQTKLIYIDWVLPLRVPELGCFLLVDSYFKERIRSVSGSLNSSKIDFSMSTKDLGKGYKFVVGMHPI